MAPTSLVSGVIREVASALGRAHAISYASGLHPSEHLYMWAGISALSVDVAL